MYPLLSALAVALLAALAEGLQARRIQAVARLAFGPAGAARPWTRLVPLLRVASLAAFTWGLVTLFLLQHPEIDSAAGKKAAETTATRVVFVADLSPSMYLTDAGSDGKLARRERMRDVVDGILQRISGNLRFGVIGFYTEALPVVMEARDPELVRNVMNGLPLSYAMPLGQTDLGTSVNAALDLVSAFPRGSTRLVIMTDGDSVNLAPLAPRPASVREVLVLGFGNPTKGTYIDGHQSRQEGDTLARLATALGGTYEDVNARHVSTSVLGDLVVTAPLRQRWLSLSALAVLAMTVGSLVYALLPIALEHWGSEWEVVSPERPSAPVARSSRRALPAS